MTGVVDTGDKFMLGVVDTNHKLLNTNIFVNVDINTKMLQAHYQGNGVN